MLEKPRDMVNGKCTKEVEKEKGRSIHRTWKMPLSVKRNNLSVCRGRGESMILVEE